MKSEDIVNLGQAVADAIVAVSRVAEAVYNTNNNRRSNQLSIDISGCEAISLTDREGGKYR